MNVDVDIIFTMSSSELTPKYCQLDHRDEVIAHP